MLTVPFNRQDNVRECEKALNALFSEWRHKFPRKSSSELLAMIAYQYASYYMELNSRYDALNERLAAMSADLDSLLGDDTPQSPTPDDNIF